MSTLNNNKSSLKMEVIIIDDVEYTVDKLVECCSR